MCPLRKQHRFPFPLRTSKLLSNFDLIHMDICGPYPTSTHWRAIYFLNIVDDYTLELPGLISWILHLLFFLLFKTSSSKSYLNSVQNIKHKQCFGCLQVSIFFFLFSTRSYSWKLIYIPQQNGVVERQHRHLLDVAEDLNCNPNLFSFMGQHILTATYLINRLPSSFLTSKFLWWPISWITIRITFEGVWMSLLCYHSWA